jgi:hypothetical protein
MPLNRVFSINHFGSDPEPPHEKTAGQASSV